MDHDNTNGQENSDFSGVLDRLDPRSREVLVLLWEGVGQAEVARRLGIEEALVAEIRAQGLGELRALLDEGVL